ncbi:serine/threonine-protein kinase [Actinomadura latina]|uniref:Serine/threonine protein kinase n=1 Tax=Actinomadura latina TaxID=163603 RepID=A0A846Z0H0_9ACTN|nr:serine/threonine-protein kinase [Actinomadura latina]NKZ03883.1 serine/threonine protein kinase [Actinomadura latina]
MTLREHRLPGFVELAELGTGTQGEVVLARHESGGPPIAIKYLASGLRGDTAARGIFRAEAQMLKRVNNPHVARLLDYLESPWGAAILLEAVPGRPLRRVLDEQEGALTAEAALATLKGSLLGLAAAHAVGVVHRDYKPANVLVQDDGQSKLIDFGVAVLTGQGGQAGTPAYMSPEQWAGGPATPATDLYAATCVFVECITGKKPFGGTTLAEFKTAHEEGFTSFESVPEPLRPLVQRGLAKSPSDRVWNAYEFVSELESVAVQAYGPDWERRGFLALGAVAATVVTAVPLAMLGGTLLAPGASATGAAASTAAGHVSAGLVQGATSVDVMAKTGTSAAKGFLSKVGGTKGAVGIGVAGVGGVIAAWLLWPGPSVGGTSHAGVHAYFTKPGVLLGQAYLPASETPYIDFRYSLAPARAKTGTEVRLVEKFRARTPGSLYYTPSGERQCLSENTDPPKTHAYGWGLGLGQNQLDVKSPDFMAFYPMPPAKRNDIPQKTTGAVVLPVRSDTVGEQQPWVQAECATISQWTTTARIVLPDHKLLPPGKYLVTPHVPMKITQASLEDEAIPPESAGGRIDGTLPMIEVLDD